MGLTQSIMHGLLWSNTVPLGVVNASASWDAFALPTTAAKVIIVSFIFKEER